MNRRSNSQPRNKNLSRNQLPPQPKDSYTQRPGTKINQAKVPKVSMFKVTSPSSFHSFTEGIHHLEVNHLYKVKQECRQIKEVTEECILEPSVMVKDISLHVHGPEEDDVFLGDPQVWANIRRGNTVFELYNPNDYDKLEKVVYGRKGMNKFFDIKLDFIRAETRYNDDILNEKSYDLKLNILGPIKQALLQGHKVEVVKTLKANGENCQVSYSPELACWVVASKNVSVQVKTLSDLDYYPSSKVRYNFAKLMAKTWFQVLSHLNQKEVEQLKIDLSNKTLVGEYIGNPEYQHLVKYPKETLIFFGIVKNNSHDICEPNEVAMKLFKKYGLNTVDMVSLGVYGDYDEICDILENQFHEVSKCTIAEEEEGCVFYFIKRDQSANNNSKDQVVSMTKLKTLEYRLFRKIREKLRNFIDGKTSLDPAKLTDKFYREAKDLVRGFEIPRQLDFYFDVFIAGLRMVSSGLNKEKLYYQDLLMNEYITFLEHVIEEAGHRKRKYAKVDFNSSVLDRQDKIGYDTPQIQRKVIMVKEEKVELEEEKKVSPRKQQYVQKSKVTEKPEEKTKTVEKKEVKPKEIINRTIFLIAPPYSLSQKGMDLLKSKLRVVEAQEFTQNLYNQQQDPAQVTLVYLPQLNGIKELEISHSEQLYYIMYNYDEEYFKSDLLKNSCDKENPNYCPESVAQKLQSLEGLHTFNQSQIQLLPDTISSLSKRANFHQVSKSEEDLFMKIDADFQKVSSTSTQLNLLKELKHLKSPPSLKDLTKESKKKVKIVEPTPSEIENGHAIYEPHNPSQKVVLVVIPVGIPGMGKTHFINNQLKPFIDSQNFGFQSISSDEMRRQLIEEFLGHNPTSTKDQAFQATTQAATSQFASTFDQLLINAAEKSQNNREVIYLDKNHPPSALKVIQQVDKMATKYPDVKFVKVAMVPEIKNQYQDYPFSLPFLMQCYMRNLRRDSHDTLTNEDPLELTKVQMLFFNLYKGQKLDQDFLKKHNFDSYFKVDFTYEHEDLELPSNLEQALVNALNMNLQKSSNLVQQNLAYKGLLSLTKVYQQFFTGLQDPSYNYAATIDQHFQTFFPKMPEPIIKKAPSPQLRQVQDTNSNNQDAQQDLEMREVVSTVEKDSPSAPTQDQAPPKKAKKSKKEGSKQEEQKTYKPYNPAGQTGNGQGQALGFEQTVKRKDKKKSRASEYLEYDDEEYQEVRIPLYISISCDKDPLLIPNLKEILGNEVKKILVAHSEAIIGQTVEDIGQLAYRPKSNSYHGWRWANSYHVTVEYLNRDPYNVEDSDIYANFKENVKVEIDICGLVVVPKKLVIGICFPHHEIKNKCPHMTLLTNEWTPVMSNTILEAAFHRKKAPMKDIYDQMLKNNGKVVDPKKTIARENVKYHPNEPTVPVYFVALDPPIKFIGVTERVY